MFFIIRKEVLGFKKTIEKRDSHSLQTMRTLITIGSSVSYVLSLLKEKM